MDIFNIFNQSAHDFNRMLSIGGQPLYVNGKQKKAIITTNSEVREFNEKYISTDFLLQRGDYVFYNNMFWMIWNQVTVPRAESYKGIMRQVERNIIFNLYYAGIREKYLLEVPAIVQRTSDYTPRIDNMMVLMESEIHIFVQDTTKTRQIFGLVNNADGQIVLGERNYDIIGISVEKKGVLDITCRMGTRNSTTNYTEGIFWNATSGAVAGWENQYDLPFLVETGKPTIPDTPEPEEPEPEPPAMPEATTQTIVGTIGRTLHTASKTFTYTWSAEALSLTETFAPSFAGYRVRLWVEPMWGNDVKDQEFILGADILTKQITVTTITVDYYLTIESIFSDGTTTVYLKPQKSSTYYGS